jgi:hypothetical protein
VGGQGTDALTGGAAPSILFGGKGKNTLTTGAGGSILIGGQTSYEHNEKALLALLGEWKGSDSIDTKITHMKSGSHLASGSPLNTKTALNAGAVDTPIGGKRVDWFLNLSSRDTSRPTTSSATGSTSSPSVRSRSIGSSRRPPPFRPAVAVDS